MNKLLPIFSTTLISAVLFSPISAAQSAEKTADVTVEYQGSANLQGTQADMNDECCQSHEFKFTSTGDVNGANALISKRNRISGPRHWSDKTVAK